MKESLRFRLDQMVERFEEVTALLSEPEIINDNKKFRTLSVEHSDLSEIAQTWQDYLQAEENLNTAEEMLDDPDMKELAEEEILAAKAKISQLADTLNIMMLPKDPNDKVPAFLEIRAGTGGDEAAIFAGDLFRMYERFAQSQGWQVEVLSANEGEHGGYKEIISRVSGINVYGRLKFESGAHRVQRVPETESQGRVHTSACTVAVMPEIEIDDATIEGAGATIGILERLITGLLLVSQNYAALGLVFTAKSVARYDKISKNSAFAEYYLIGSLFSLLAVLVLYQLYQLGSW